MTFIPISALHGDNVVERSTRMNWYQGPSLLYHLEHVHIASDRNLIDNRFPVQWIIRPMSDEHHDYRGYSGQVAGGVLKPGDEVMVRVKPAPAAPVAPGVVERDAPAALPAMGMGEVVIDADDVQVFRRQQAP